MKRIIAPYIIAYIILSVILFCLYFNYSKIELHMFLCDRHTKIGDFFFRYYTQLAEWPLYIIGLVPLLFKRYWWTIVYAISEVISEVIILILKAIFELPRPANVFRKTDIKLPEVEGVKMYLCDSFPSGHACTFFVFFTTCALILGVYAQKKGYLEEKRSLLFRTLIITCVFLMLMSAILGAYSRVYLSQHFFIDVYVGSFIGILVPCAVIAKFKDKLIY